MIIALVNQKGGVGKTTTCINLAAYLAVKNKKTLLIDLDAQANASSGLGYEKKIIKRSLYHVLTGECDLNDIIKRTDRKNLFLCPGNIDLSASELSLANEDQREYLLKQKLQGIKEEYDYILIDCPPSLGLLTVNALVASDRLIIPIQAEYYALEGVSMLMESYMRVKQSLNSDLEILGVLMTMVDTRTQLSKQVSEEVRKHFNNKVFKTVIPRNVRLSEAPGFGESIYEYDKHSKGARAYLALAKEVISRT
ncbi:MAG: AAA family ATPase [Eubacteriales bacterium]|nr:AAA family ATPase [Eubacteriales bacterium]